MCRSVPQMVVLVIRTTASVASRSKGFGHVFQLLLSWTMRNESFHSMISMIDGRDGKNETGLLRACHLSGNRLNSDLRNYKPRHGKIIWAVTRIRSVRAKRGSRDIGVCRLRERQYF